MYGTCHTLGEGLAILRVPGSPTADEGDEVFNINTGSASAAYDMTALMILDIVNTAILLGGNAVLFDMKISPPAMLLDFFSERYEASLWPATTMSLDWYVSMASGWVAV